MEVFEILENELQELKEKGLFRELNTLPGAGGKLLINGKEFLNFSSNDYLNLSLNSYVKNRSINAIQKYSTSAASSRLMTGHLELHHELEESLAEMTGGKTALVFGSGFLTNLGVLSAIAGPGDEIFADKLNHASLIDGMILSRAKWHRYKHKNMEHLEKLISGSSCKGKKIIVSDSIFSMDGDIAPVQELYEISKKHNALLIIDEAHAIGIFGKDGGGICRDKGISPDILVGTLSKSLGSYGGFAITSSLIKNYLINKARSFIFSTALLPAAIGAALESIKIISSTPHMGKDLIKRARIFREELIGKGFKLPEAESQILSLIIGENKKTMAFSKELKENRILATAIRPPTVPKGTSRLRLTVTLAHSIPELKQTAGIIEKSGRKLGIL